MKGIEKKTLRFLEQLQQAYLAERDIEAVLSMLDDKIHWTGFGRCGACSGIEETRQCLFKEAEELPGAFVVVKSDYSAEAVSDTICMAAGSLTLKEETSPSIPELCIYFSCVCCDTEQGMRLLQIHISQTSLQNGGILPLSGQAGAKEREGLRSLIEAQASALREKIRDLNALTDNLPGGVMCCDYTGDLNLIHYSEGFLKLFGYTKEELRERFHDRFADMIYRPDLETTWVEVSEQMKKGPTKQIEYRVRHKNGHMITVLDRGQLVRDDEGREIFYCILIDVTESRKAMEELRLSLEKHQIIMDQTTDILFEWDIKQDIITYSANWIKKFGYEPITSHIRRDMVSRGHYHPDDRAKVMRVEEEILRTGEYSEAELRIMTAGGAYIWCRVRVTPQRDDMGGLTRAIGVIIDIDREKVAAQQLRDRADRDPLTGLYNKGTTQKKAEELLKTAAPGHMCAFIILDVDNFKLVNDIYGHISGDAMLTDISSALKEIFGEDDLVGRIGGDEFAAMLQNVKSREEVSKKAEEIFGAFRTILATGESRPLSCSIGIAMAPEDGQSFYSLYRCADLALYYAKTKGKNRYAFYTAFMVSQESMDERMSELRSAREGREESREKVWKGQDICTWMAEYVFHTLYQTMNFETVLPHVMEMIGRQFDVSRAYVFEDSADGSCSDNTFEWCHEKCPPKISCLSRVSHEFPGDYYGNFDENGIFYCRDVRTLSPNIRKFLEGQGVKSVLQCAIRDNGKIRGFVGFDECKNNRFWTQDQIRALSMVAEVISIFLITRRAQDKTYVYRCGVIDCFNEMIHSGLKKLALAHPCDTKEERDRYLAFCQEICGKYNTHYYVEDVPLLTDLFPLSMNRGKYNIIFYSDPKYLQQYLKIKEEKQELQAQGLYEGERRTEIACCFGQLLSYPRPACLKLIEENKEKE